jgi:glycosyltransferase involved in cell wall biosynthesis
MPILTPPYIIFFFFVFLNLILVFYYLYFFRRLVSYKPGPRKESLQHPVSVIVCGRNEDENFARNIPGLVFQQYHSTRQIVVVNDNSTDDTKYILQELNHAFKSLKIIELAQEPKMIAGKKFPLSVGIREADYEILLLTDADCVPATEHWLQKMQDGYDEGIEIVLGYGPYKKKQGFLNKVIRFETFHTALQYLSYALAGQPYMGVGRNLSYKKGLFLKHKGFAPINHLPGGDDDLFISKAATRKNTAIVIDPDAHTLSEPKKTWKEWKHQKTRHFSTAKYYKPQHKFLLGLYSLSHFLYYFAALAAFLVFDWRWVLGIFLAKTMIQFIIFGGAMKRLNERDLLKWLPVMDLWNIWYYFMFAPYLWKKERQTW